MSNQKHHGVMFLCSEGAKARSVASKLFATQDDYATRVGGKTAKISPSPPNKNCNSDTKELRFLFYCGIIISERR